MWAKQMMGQAYALRVSRGGCSGELDDVESHSHYRFHEGYGMYVVRFVSAMTARSTVRKEGSKEYGMYEEMVSMTRASRKHDQGQS